MTGFVWAAYGYWIECSYPGSSRLAADGGSYFWYFKRAVSGGPLWA